MFTVAWARGVGNIHEVVISTVEVSLGETDRQGNDGIPIEREITSYPFIQLGLSLLVHHVCGGGSSRDICDNAPGNCENKEPHVDLDWE